MKPETRRELRRLLLFAAAVLVLVFIARVYRGAEDAPFLWDDHVLVEGDAPYRHASFGQLMTESFWPQSPLADARAPYYRPAVLLSYRADIALGGRPAELHITNLLLHLGVCALLAIVAVRLGASYPAAIAAMLVWGVMPRLSEDVVWIAGRTDVLASFFGFGALALWPEIGAPGRWPRARSVAAGTFLFAALCSKEVAVAFVAAVLVAALLKRADRIRTATCLGLPFVAYLALRTIALAAPAPGARPLALGGRLGTILDATERYAEMTVDALRPRTSIGVIGEVDAARVAVGAIIVVLALAAAVAVARRGSFGVRVGLVLAAVGVAPVLHVVPIALSGAVTADRLLYVPLAGLIVAISVAASPVRVLAPIGAAVALVLGVATSTRVADYTEETRFWTVAAETAHPHNAIPRMALASWLLRAGETELACPLYERAAREDVNPAAHRRAREGLASCWARAGRYDDALHLDEELAHEYPESARISLALGFAYLHVRAFDAAEAAFRRAAALDAPFVARYGVSPERLAVTRNDEARADELGAFARAEHFAALGRGPEAAGAYRAVALDDKAEPEERRSATVYLIRNGPLAYADAAFAVCPPPPLDWDSALRHILKHRHTTDQAVATLRARVEALAH